MLFPFNSSDAPQRVVVTGVGVVSAFGLGWKTNAEGFRCGRSTLTPVSLFDVSRQRVRHACEVRLPTSLPPNQLSAKTLRRLNRASTQLLHAAAEAVSQAGWSSGDSVCQVLGTACCGMESGEAFYRGATQRPPLRQGQATRLVYYQAQRQALDLAEAFGFGGPITVLSNSCASGSNAIGHAWERVRSGQFQQVITGGYDALSQLVFAGFDALQALSPTTCRPFDSHRDGLALGEGAAILAIESLACARRRGAQVLAEIVGYGTATDSHNLTQPHPEGGPALVSMQEACSQAQVCPEHVGYINAHGTGTVLNDAAEAQAINRWAGAHASTIPVSSTKGCVGHLLGAAGALEAAVCVMVLREQWLPPEPGLRELDPGCRFPVVRSPQEAKVDVALSNSLGFGGANATLAFRRWV